MRSSQGNVLRLSDEGKMNMVKSLLALYIRVTHYHVVDDFESTIEITIYLQDFLEIMKRRF